jgi:hypothetical protein
MTHDELQAIMQAAGGGPNALAYADALLTKINRLEATGQYQKLLVQLRNAREAGDFRGRVLEINFSEAFVREGINLTYGARQGMSGDIDLLWPLPPQDVFIESKLLGQDRATRDRISQQLENHGVSAIELRDDTRDVASLQLDICWRPSKIDPLRGVIFIEN